MIPERLQIKNFRSIKDTGDFPVTGISSVAGVHPAATLDIIKAIKCFSSAGAGGIRKEDFNDPGASIVIRCTFHGLSEQEIAEWGPYLINGKLMLEKLITLRPGSDVPEAVVHAYRTETRQDGADTPGNNTSFH